MTQRQLEALTRAECLNLLGEQRVGRLVYMDDDGPLAVPVNYALCGGDVVVRVAGGEKQAAAKHPLAFEVDHIDEQGHAGWSVLVRGRGEEIPLERVAALLREMGSDFPSPWATGVHNVWLRIRSSSITGRRLGAVAFQAVPGLTG